MNEVQGASLLSMTVTWVELAPRNGHSQENVRNLDSPYSVSPGSSSESMRANEKKGAEN